jgi:hypothetical protein
MQGSQTIHISLVNVGTMNDEKLKELLGTIAASAE